MLTSQYSICSQSCFTKTNILYVVCKKNARKDFSWDFFCLFTHGTKNIDCSQNMTCVQRMLRSTCAIFLSKISNISNKYFRYRIIYSRASNWISDHTLVYFLWLGITCPRNVLLVRHALTYAVAHRDCCYQAVVNLTSLCGQETRWSYRLRALAAGHGLCVRAAACTCMVNELS